MSMFFYYIKAMGFYTNPIECVAARSHQEAADIYIETMARWATSVGDRLLNDDEIRTFIECPECLCLNYGEDEKAEYIFVEQIEMPAAPGVAEKKECKKIAIDIEGSLKRQRMIDPNFKFIGHNVDEVE